MQKNVTEWETCGGTGIVFRDAEEALHKLRPLIMLHNKNDGVDNIWFETMEDYEEVEGSFIQKYGANDSLLCIIINGVDFCDAANDLAYDKNTPLPAYTHNTVGWVSEDLLDIYRCPAQRKRNTTELLTCSECGEPGCTTIMPSIRQDENYVYWEKLRQVPGGKTLDFSFCFDKTDYKEALDDLDPYVDYEDASGDVSETLVEQARMIAAHAHRDQVDKAGKPYIGHLTSVAELVVTNKET